MLPLYFFFGLYLFLVKGLIILIVISILIERSPQQTACVSQWAWGLQQMLTSQKCVVKHNTHVTVTLQVQNLLKEEKKKAACVRSKRSLPLSCFG